MPSRISRRGRAFSIPLPTPPLPQASREVIATAARSRRFAVLQRVALRCHTPRCAASFPTPTNSKLYSTRARGSCTICVRPTVRRWALVAASHDSPYHAAAPPACRAPLRLQASGCAPPRDTDEAHAQRTGCNTQHATRSDESNAQHAAMRKRIPCCRGRRRGRRGGDWLAVLGGHAVRLCRRTRSSRSCWPRSKAASPMRCRSPIASSAEEPCNARGVVGGAQSSECGEGARRSLRCADECERGADDAVMLCLRGAGGASQRIGANR